MEFYQEKSGLTIGNGIDTLTVMDKVMPELEFLSWNKFHKLCFELAKKIKAERQDLDTIVSISRGGHVVSRILSDLLGLPIFNVSMAYYESINQRRKFLTISQKLGVFLDDNKILLVDEIVDTGASLERALSYLNRVRCKEIYSVAVTVKPQAVIKPDLHVFETSKWVVHPYEVRETYLSLVAIGKKQGVSSKQVEEMMVRGGMKQEMVEYVASLG